MATGRAPWVAIGVQQFAVLVGLWWCLVNIGVWYPNWNVRILGAPGVAVKVRIVALRANIAVVTRLAHVVAHVVILVAYPVCALGVVAHRLIACGVGSAGLTPHAFVVRYLLMARAHNTLSRWLWFGFGLGFGLGLGLGLGLGRRHNLETRDIVGGVEGEVGTRAREICTATAAKAPRTIVETDLLAQRLLRVRWSGSGLIEQAGEDLALAVLTRPAIRAIARVIQPVVETSAVVGTGHRGTFQDIGAVLNSSSPQVRTPSLWQRGRHKLRKPGSARAAMIPRPCMVTDTNAPVAQVLAVLARIDLDVAASATPAVLCADRSTAVAIECVDQIRARAVVKTRCRGTLVDLLSTVRARIPCSAVATVGVGLSIHARGIVEARLRDAARLCGRALGSGTVDTVATQPNV